MRYILSLLLFVIVACGCSSNSSDMDVSKDIADIRQAIEAKDVNTLYRIREDMGMDPDRARYIVKVTKDSTIQLHGAMIAVLLPCEKAARVFIDEAKESTIEHNNICELANCIEEIYELMNYSRAFAVFKSTLNDYELRLTTDERAQLYVRVNTPEVLAEALNEDPDSALTKAIIRAYKDTPKLQNIFVSNLQK